MQLGEARRELEAVREASSEARRGASRPAAAGDEARVKAATATVAAMPAADGASPGASARVGAEAAGRQAAAVLEATVSLQQQLEASRLDLEARLSEMQGKMQARERDLEDARREVEVCKREGDKQRSECLSERYRAESLDAELREMRGEMASHQRLAEVKLLCTRNPIRLRKALDETSTRPRRAQIALDEPKLPANESLIAHATIAHPGGPQRPTGCHQRLAGGERGACARRAPPGKRGASKGSSGEAARAEPTAHHSARGTS